MEEKDKEILKSAIAKFGTDAQIMKLQEELLELAWEINKIMSDPNWSNPNIIDEIADVFIMMAQSRIIFNPIEIDERIRFKLDRLKTIVESKE